MPPIDINAVKQALLARAQRGALGGGGGTPMIGQTSNVGGATPTGGAPTPRPMTPPNQPTTPPPAPRVNIGSRQAGAPAAAGGAARVAMAAQGPNFDDETKKIAKALVSKLISYL